MTSTPIGFKLHTKGHNFADIYLEEGLDLGPLLDLLLGHTLGDQLGVSVDAGNKSVSERLVGGTLIVRLDNKSFASCKASIEDQDNLALLHNLTHFVLLFSSRVVYTDIKEEKEGLQCYSSLLYFSTKNFVKTPKYCVFTEKFKINW